MLKIEEFVTASPEQFKIIIKGMRNPKNSWNRMDSEVCFWFSGCEKPRECTGSSCFELGENDHKLMDTLNEGGPVHAKYRRMIPVWVTITAPLYWWKEFDTYKVGTVCNSCSTMHKIHAKEFELEDFSYDYLIGPNDEEYMKDLEPFQKEGVFGALNSPLDDLEYDIGKLNAYRKLYLKTKLKKWWQQMIQRLPTEYNQMRTIYLNYEVLVNIYRWRKNHKLDEWHTFCRWIEELPYSELITGKVESDE